MDSRDLYKGMQELYKKESEGCGLFPTGKVSISDCEAMFYDYAGRKLQEVDQQGILADNLEALFDRLDEHFQSPEEKESFYQNYVHCLLGYCNDNSEQAILWELKMEPEDGDSYPRFEKQQCITFFQTLENQSHKDTALWLLNALKRESAKAGTEEKIQYIKKQSKDSIK